jgi:hypothetical protein
MPRRLATSFRAVLILLAREGAAPITVLSADGRRAVIGAG